MADNTRLDLIHLEYDEIRATLRDLISIKTPFWQNAHESDPLAVLIDELANLADMFHFYLEQRTNEMILTRAQRKKSVIDLGKVFDYHLTRPFTTVYQVRVRAKASRPQNVSATQTFPVGSQFHSDKKSFYLREEVAADFTNFVPLQVFEGVYHEDTFNLAPLAAEQRVFELPLRFPDVSQNFFTLTVDGEVWEEETFSPSVTFNKKKFIVETDEDGYSTVVFNGYKYDLPQDLSLSSNILVSVSYVSTTGIEGKIADPLEIDSFDLPYDVPLDFSSSFEIDSGSNILLNDFVPEADWRESRKKVASMLSTLWRAVSLNDYEKLSLTLSTVSSARATRKDNVENRHVAELWLKLNGSPSNPSSVLSDVQEFLQERSCVGVGVEVNQAPLVPAFLAVEVLILSKTPEAQLRADLTQKAQELFDSLDVGESLSVDTVYTTLAQVAGIVNLKINRMSFALNDVVNHLSPQTKQLIFLSQILITVKTLGTFS